MDAATHAPLKRILILGGGTAGWMAACALSAALAPGKTEVWLVESDAIGTVGVGEATVPTIRSFNQDIGIDEVEFLRKTEGTFKLGIEFDGWRKDGRPFFHGFGDFVVNTGPFSTLNQWLYARRGLEGAEADAAAGRLDDYAVSAVMARQGRFCAPDKTRNSPLYYFNYAFHFDASLYAAFLRQRAERQGVRRIEGLFRAAETDPETGHVTALTLEDGQRLEADLFLDCSGFAALLAGKLQGVPYRDYSHWLPVDRAIAVPTAANGPPQPFTRASARKAGWQWRIPLQNRVGNGLVYSSAHLDDEEAEAILLRHLDAEPLAQPRRLKFKTGRREAFWEKNVISLGLASGFLEPLESTSISLIQSGINRLIALMPDRSFNRRLRDEYNRQIGVEFDRIRDFIILHYCLSDRDDSDFWRHVRTMALPDTLDWRIDTFRETGVVVLLDDETFVTPSWQSLYVGLGLLPTRLDPLMAQQDPHEMRQSLTERRRIIAETVARLPTQEAFLQRFC